MGKKKTENTSISDSNSDSILKKIINAFKSETLQFATGLILIIFSVYMLLSFTSFFITGAADHYPSQDGYQDLFDQQRRIPFHPPDPEDAFQAAVCGDRSRQP